MARSSGDTLSLNDLAGATGITQGANVSLNAINGSAGTIVKIDDEIKPVQEEISSVEKAKEGKKGGIKNAN